MTDLITPGQERYLAKQRARAIKAGRGERPKGFTETADQRIVRMQKEAQAEKVTREAALALQKANTFAQQLRDNEIKAAEQSVQREKVNRAQNEYIISKNILSTPPRSETIVRQAIEQQQNYSKEIYSSQENKQNVDNIIRNPVASDKQGEILYADKKGSVYRKAATTNEGGVILTESKPFVKTSAMVLPNKNSEGFSTPLFLLSKERRKDIIKFGENLQDNANKPGLFGVQRSQLGYELRELIGSNAVAFGYNPKGYVVENIVLPSQAGAAATTGANIIVSGTKQVLGSTASKVTEKTLIGTGFYGIAKETLSRNPNQQRPDIIFAILGGAKASKNNVEIPKPTRDAEFYSGMYVPGARSKQIRTANRPTSKAEIRKQSFNQNYNPNVYRTGNAVVERTPRNIKAIEILQGKIRATQAKISKTGEGTIISARSAYIATQKDSPYIAEPNRVVVNLGKGGKEQTSIKFTQAKDFTSGNVQKKEYSGDIKSSQLYSRPTSQQSYPNNVQGSVLIEKVNINSITKNPGREVLRSPSFVSGKPSGVVGSTIPEYELVPNAPSKYFSTYSKQQNVRGGFRFRKTGDKVLNFRPDVQTPKNNYLIINNDNYLNDVPQKDIVLQRNIPTATEKFSSNKIVSVQKPGIISANKYNNKLSDNLKYSPLFAPKINILENNTIGQRNIYNQNQKQEQSQTSLQIPIYDLLSSQIQITSQKSNLITDIPIVKNEVNENNNIPKYNIPRIPRIKESNKKRNNKEEETIEPIEPIVILGNKKKSKKKLVVPGFDVFVKSKGEFVKSNVDSLSEEQAFNLGALKVARSSSASFKVVPSFKEAKSDIIIRGIDKQQFRQSKRTPGVVVEKSRYRINTPGELREITYKGLSQRKRGLL